MGFVYLVLVLYLNSPKIKTPLWNPSSGSISGVLGCSRCGASSALCCWLSYMGHMASDCTLKHVKVTPVLCFAVSASGKS